MNLVFFRSEVKKKLFSWSIYITLLWQSKLQHFSNGSMIWMWQRSKICPQSNSETLNLNHLLRSNKSNHPNPHNKHKIYRNTSINSIYQQSFFGMNDSQKWRVALYHTNYLHTPRKLPFPKQISLLNTKFTMQRHSTRFPPPIQIWHVESIQTITKSRTHIFKFLTK